VKVAVTGAGGFIGRHVVAALERIDGPPPVLVFRPGSAPPGAGADRVVEMDLARPPRDAFERLGEPDVLVHLAWDGLPNYTSARHLEEELPAQRAFLGQLLEAGLAGLTVTGTCFEYGMQPGALGEDAPAAPVTAYGRAKDELRRWLEDEHARRPFRLTWARLFYLHGEGQAPGSLLPQLHAAITRGDPVFNLSGGEQLRDYLPVEEAAGYLVGLARNRLDNGTVNVCSGRPISVRELVEGEVRRRGSMIELNFGHYPYPEHEPMAFWGDRTRLDRILEASRAVV
jgi:dTDP-6-deoxy-L-talose 4-dehydrogenase (NAD+)